MRAVVQRVSEASVVSEGRVLGAIGRGFLVLLGIAEEDGEKELEMLAKKIPLLRVFPDEDGKMNRSITDVGGELLVVSQFTLIADTAKGNRPSFFGAARPEKARPMYEKFLSLVGASGLKVERGEFGADMQVSLVNDGPVTILLDTKDWTS